MAMKSIVDGTEKLEKSIDTLEAEIRVLVVLIAHVLIVKFVAY
jgi:hypothetical protein